ncbi:MAG: O-antigen ligase family protein [Alphaproteobacteria bacterium]
MQKIDKFITSAAGILLLLFPLCLIAGRAPADVALSLIGLLFLIHTVLMRDYDWFKPLWVRALLLLWGWMILRVLFAEDPEFGIGRALSFIRYGAFAVALGWWLLPRNPELMKRLMMVIVAAGLFLAVDGLIQFVSGFDLFGKPKFSDTRLTGPYNSPTLGNMIYPLAALSAVFLLSQMNRQKAVWHNALYVIAAGGMFIGVFISGERSPTLLLLFALGIIFILTHNDMRKKMIMLAVAGLVGAGAMMLYKPALVERQIGDTIGKTTAFKESGYGKVFADGLKMIEQNFMIGVGVKHYRLECAKPKFKSEQCLTHPHNSYLEIFAENGVIGFILFLGFIGFLLRDIFKNHALWRADVIKLGAVGLICAELWPIIGTSSFFASWGVMGLWLAIGIASATDRSRG